MNRGRAGSATPRAVVLYANPPELPPLGDPPEPPLGAFVLHFTVTEITGIFLWPGLRTTITMFDVSASFCEVGKVADTISTGNRPLGSSSSCIGPLPQPQ